MIEGDDKTHNYKTNYYVMLLEKILNATIENATLAKTFYAYIACSLPIISRRRSLLSVSLAVWASLEEPVHLVL